MEKNITTNKDAYLSPMVKNLSCNIGRIICGSTSTSGGYEELIGGDTSDWF